MSNLTKIAALPTGGGCQSALRPEDRGVAFATGGPVIQQLVPILIAQAMAGEDGPTVFLPKPTGRITQTFTVGDVATRTMVQSAIEASARRMAKLKNDPEGTC